MKNHLVVLSAVLFTLSACSQNPVVPPTPPPAVPPVTPPVVPPERLLSGTAEGWTQGVATIAAEQFDGDGNVVFTFAEGEVGADGRFSLELPESVPDAQLSEVTTGEDLGCTTAGVTVSTGSYRAAGFGELSVRQGGVDLGFLSLSSSYSFAAYESNAVGDVFVSREYADRAVAVTGECTFDGAQDSFEMSLQPGWNAVSYTVTGVTPEGNIASGVFRVGAPEGVRWFFVPPLSDAS